MVPFQVCIFLQQRVFVDCTSTMQYLGKQFRSEVFVSLAKNHGACFPVHFVRIKRKLLCTLRRKGQTIQVSHVLAGQAMRRERCLLQVSHVVQLENSYRFDLVLLSFAVSSICSFGQKQLVQATLQRGCLNFCDQSQNLHVQSKIKKVKLQLTLCCCGFHRKIEEY